MAVRLRLPSLAFAGLSICLSIAIIGCAGRTLHLFDTQQSSNAWLLPVWPDHFDTRGLEALVGTSAAILVLNVVLALALFLPAFPANIVVLVCAFCSSVIALLAVVFPAVLDNNAPAKDTLQTWTCRWSDTAVNRGDGPPDQFSTICHETRFAFYTSIPLLVLQLLLLGWACYAVLMDKPSKALQDVEKGQELDQVRQGSWDTKSGNNSPTSVTADSARILSNKM